MKDCVISGGWFMVCKVTFYNIPVNKRNDIKIFLIYIFILIPKQLFINIYVNVFVKCVYLTKQTITSCFVTEKFWKINFPSPARVCDDRNRQLNHLRSLSVLSARVNNLSFWKFEFSQERQCHGAVKMTMSERWV